MHFGDHLGLNFILTVSGLLFSNFEKNDQKWPYIKFVENEEFWEFFKKVAFKWAITVFDLIRLIKHIFFFDDRD